MPWVLYVMDNVVRALRDPNVCAQFDGAVLLKLYKNFLQVNYGPKHPDQQVVSHMSKFKLLSQFKKVRPSHTETGPDTACRSNDTLSDCDLQFLTRWHR